jgi:glucokinase
MYIGIDIGGSHIAIGLFNNEKIMIKKIVKDINNTYSCDDILEYIILTIEEIQKEYSNSIISIGIGVPGIVSNGVWVKANYLKINNFPICKKLQEELKINVYVENDSNCAAIGEIVKGKTSYNNAVFITVGSGIGGAIIIDNKVICRDNSAIAEFGHVNYERNGLKCSCGNNGCFSQYASMKALRKRISDKLNIPIVNNNQVLELLKNNNEIAKEELAKQIECLKVLFGNIINILDPEAIIIGGGFAYFKEYFNFDFDNTKDKYVYNKNSTCKIIVTDLGNDAGIIGAAFQKTYR